MFASMANEKGYTVKKLADLAGVSVRTLHLYDEIGLLKPSVRTEAGYRLYGERELLRLQQILLYKEFELSLQQIGDILDDPDFDVVSALENHKLALSEKKNRLNQLLVTIDNTINKMKNGMALTDDELYKGFPKEYRDEAIETYGAESIERSEKYLKSLGKEGFAKLKDELAALTDQLIGSMKSDPASETVQRLIAKHYEIIRKFWGTHGTTNNQAEAYAGLGDLYVADDRYTKGNPEFAKFMNAAMKIYAAKLSK